MLVLCNFIKLNKLSQASCRHSETATLGPVLLQTAWRHGGPGLVAELVFSYFRIPEQ